MTKLISLIIVSISLSVLANSIDNKFSKSELLDLQTAVLNNAKVYSEEIAKENLPDVKAERQDMKDKHIYVFVSLSMPEKALTQLSLDAAQTNAVLVLRGLKDNSYKATANALQRIIDKTNNGFIIDPELFEIFRIQEVPTFVVSDDGKCSSGNACFNKYNKLSGNVSLHYAIQKLLSAGELGVY